ncbi:sulfur carrier protein ThiS [Porphyromonas circumdentaria]|uniref:Sulfur carrier protein n=1 Tax=Porphyromonas circumdentaria TaxID=29524 RepID=A0A1T4LGQ7_9PORP|nr:sulfur carrier protein ThiS [Porphyromonas circumdentaria]MBB6275263.1 thiamine biosynthesis protein ThiS [Porphyromonas circumdentaria]SJZ53873.1 sulfur carrier protein [Porphyromonas circumdentaria]
MQIELNQKIKKIPDGCTVSSLLSLEQIEGGYVAVAVNQEVIKRDNWESTYLKDGDKILVIGAVRGG